MDSGDSLLKLALGEDAIREEGCNDVLYVLLAIIIRVFIAVTGCSFGFAHCVKHCLSVIKRDMIVFEFLFESCDLSFV